MSEHTPGPYIVDEMSDAFIIREKRTNKELALIVRRGTSEQEWAEEEANAHMFAADPDLLAACEKQERYEKHKNLCINALNGRVCADCVRLQRRATEHRQSAIAKATMDK